MSLAEFMLEQGVLSVTIGTIIGFGTTNIASQIRKHIFTPLIHMIVGTSRTSFRFVPRNIRQPMIEIIASILEFFLLVMVVIGVYHYAIRPFFDKEFKEQEKDEKEMAKWRANILDNVEQIASDPIPYLSMK